MRAPYRVIQWATGSVGREALRAILIHPALELAGVLVHSEEKSGKDAGELCSAPATGVLATNDHDAIVGSQRILMEFECARPVLERVLATMDGSGELARLPQ